MPKQYTPGQEVLVVYTVRHTAKIELLAQDFETGADPITTALDSELLPWDKQEMVKIESVEVI